MRRDLTAQDMLDRQTVASEVVRHDSGMRLIHFILDDLGVYDISETNSEMVLHNFGLLMLKRYFNTTVDQRDHRSLLTEAIIGAWTPPEGEK